MENGSFIDDFPIKTSIYNGFSMAMLNNQRVHILYMCTISIHIQFVGATLLPINILTIFPLCKYSLCISINVPWKIPPSPQKGLDFHIRRVPSEHPEAAKQLQWEPAAITKRTCVLQNDNMWGLNKHADFPSGKPTKSYWKWPLK